MADGMFLNPLAARQAAMQAGMISPQQLSQQGLLQQITGTMANAGTMIGGGVGGLFGAQYGAELENAARLQEYEKQRAAEAFKQQQEQNYKSMLMQKTQAEIEAMGKPKPKDYGDAREALAYSLFGKSSYADLTPQQASKVEDTIQQGKKQVAEASGSKTIKDVAGTLAGYNTLIKPYRSSYDTAKNAETLINEAKASNNPSAWEAARTQLAKAVGENKLSNEDIKRMGVNPALVEGAKDWLSKKVESVPTNNTMNQLIVLSKLIQRYSGQRIQEESTRYREASKAMLQGETPSYDLLYPVPDFPGPGVLKPIENAATSATPSVKTVNWNDLK